MNRPKKLGIATLLATATLALFLASTSAAEPTPQPSFTPLPLPGQVPVESPPAQTQLTPPPQTSPNYAEAILRYTNEQRARSGLAPLQLQPNLSAAALAHSQEMLKLGYFSHTSPTAGRRTPMDRLRQVGISPSYVAENIFQCSGYPLDQIAKLTVDNWMQSPGHRRNILDSRATHMGAGLAEQNGEIYVTQVFGGGL